MTIFGVDIREFADRRVLVFGIRGEIPREALCAAQETMLRAVRHCTKVIIVDLSQAARVSSSGPGLLAYYARLFGARGVLVLAVRAPTEVMKRIKPTGVERMVPFFNTLGEALERAGLSQGSEAPEPT